MHAELLVDMAHMGRHRAFRENEIIADIRLRAACGQKEEHIELPSRQPMLLGDRLAARGHIRRCRPILVAPISRREML